LIVAELLGYFIGLGRYHKARSVMAKIARTFGPDDRAQMPREVVGR
jgi:hypothetical protein